MVSEKKRNRLVQREAVLPILRELQAPLIALIFLIIASSIISREFLTPYNQEILLLQMTPLAMLALGEAIIILMGSIDLSPGSAMALAGTISALSLKAWGFSFEQSILAGILTGMLIGLINGLLVTKARIPSFVATLSMLVAGRGLVLVITGGQSITGLSSYKQLFLSEFAGISIMTYIMILTLIAFYILLRRTSFGLMVYAIGGNEDAFRISGLNADLVKLTSFIIAGLLYGVAGMMMNARLEVAYPWTGWGYELDAIASCVLGGILLTGGVGNPIGPIIGAYILTLITNILILLGVDPYYQWVVKGVILALAASALTRGLRYAK